MMEQDNVRHFPRKRCPYDNILVIPVLAVFFYSFIGWCIEVCSAAVQHRKFVNRGFVAGPLCPIYGFGAMLFEIFLPELTEYPFFLFLGGFVLSSLLEYSTGMFLKSL